MSLSKKLFLISLVTTNLICLAEPTHTTFNNQTTNFSKPADRVYRLATKSEKALADAKAADDLSKLHKSGLQKFVESISKELNYLYNAQPFGVEHGLVKGADVVATIAVLVSLYNRYQGSSDTNSKK